MKNALIAAAVIACVGLAGCGGDNESPSAPTPASVSVRYKVDAPYSASVTYTLSPGSTSQQSQAITPWERTFTATTGQFLYLSAQNDSSSGCVYVDIYVNGRLSQTSHSCGAYVIATVSGSA